MSVDKFCDRMEGLELRDDCCALVRDRDLDALLRVVREAALIAHGNPCAPWVRSLVKALDALPGDNDE